MTLSADDDITFTAAGDLTSSGTLTVTADDDSTSDAGSGGAITMADGTVFDAGSGTIALTSDEAIALGQVRTTDSTTSAVTITSTSGAVTDANGSSGNVVAASGRLTASTSGGFGTTADAIETEVNSVSIANSASGNINLFESDNLTVASITQSVVGNSTGTNGNITVSFNGTLTGEENVSLASGNVFGLISFNQRKILQPALLALEGTGKTVGDVAQERTNNLGAFLDNNFQSNLVNAQSESGGTTLAGRLPGTSNNFSTDVFAKQADLVQVAESPGSAYQDLKLEAFNDVWGDGSSAAQSAPAQPQKPQPQNTAQTDVQIEDDFFGSDDANGANEDQDNSGNRVSPRNPRKPNAVGKVSRLYKKDKAVNN